MEANEVSRLLDEVNAGDTGAFDSLVWLVYGELRENGGIAKAVGLDTPEHIGQFTRAGPAGTTAGPRRAPPRGPMR